MSLTLEETGSGDVTGVLLWMFRVLSAVFIAANLLFLYNRRQNADIPGPWQWPLIGSLHMLGLRPHASLSRMREKYGDIFRIQIGTKPVVVLNGLETIRKALEGQPDVFAGRPALYTFLKASEGKTMCFNSCSPEWKIHRRLAERALKMVSSDASFVENVLMREINFLVEKMVDSGKTPYNPLQDILWAVAHVKYSLCYGNSREDEDFERMIHTTMDLIGCHNRGNAINFFSFAKLFLLKKYRHINRVCDAMLALTEQKERAHIESYRPERVRDILDALIKLGVESKCPLEQDQVLHTVQEYIGAGLDIVYITFSWILLYLAAFPDIQGEIQREIEEVIGKSRPAQIKDMSKMPYTEAFMLETLRHSSIVPFALPHSTTEDTRLDGKFIAKDTFVLVNFYSVNRDSAVWEDVDSFKPARFLSAGTVNRALSDKCVSYSFGRRRCLGEQLSKHEMFLFITTVLQRCNIRKPPRIDKYSLTPMFGVCLKPQPFDILVENRD